MFGTHRRMREVTIQKKDSQRTRPLAVNRPRELHFIGSKEFYGYSCQEGAAGNDNGETWRGFLSQLHLIYFIRRQLVKQFIYINF